MTAARPGLHGPAGLIGSCGRYRLTDAERGIANSPFNPVTIARRLAGWAIGRATVGRYLDEVLCKGATFGDLRARSGIVTWINAPDIATNTPFLFSPRPSTRLFRPRVLRDRGCRRRLGGLSAGVLAHRPRGAPGCLRLGCLRLGCQRRGACGWAEPDRLTAARFNPEASSAMRAHACAPESCAVGDRLGFVKAAGRRDHRHVRHDRSCAGACPGAAAHAPMTPEQALRLKRMPFLVAHAGVEADCGWTRRLPRPCGALPAPAASPGSAPAIGARDRRLRDLGRRILDRRGRRRARGAGTVGASPRRAVGTILSVRVVSGVCRAQCRAAILAAIRPPVAPGVGE